jgi:hypothetical protein
MPKKSGTHHVVPSADGGWDVKKGGASRSSGHYDRKQDAVDAGRKVSQNRSRVASLMLQRVASCFWLR